MKFIITERQHKLLVENKQLDLFVDDNIPEKSVTYSFKTMKPWKNKSTGVWFVYFNNGEKIVGELETGLGDQLIFLSIGDKTYTTNSGDFRFSNGTGSIELKDFKSSNPGVDNVLFPKEQISSKQIIEVLSMAFPDNWEPETNYFTAGLRGIHTIGEKLGTNESWSIMNYFDTKTEIKEIMNQSYSKSKSKLSFTYWLIDELKYNDKFVKILVDRQWQSIDMGLKTEKLAEEIIGGTEDVKFYPPGSKMDRYNGVDMTIDNVNYQIKPLISYDEDTNTVKTYGMRDYQDKKMVNKILFVNIAKMLEFDNKKYSPSFNSVTFSSPPTKITDVN
jgi:hypothetical protein